MFEILFLVIIIWVVVKRVKRIQEGGGSVRGNSSLPRTTVTNTDRNNVPARQRPMQSRPAQEAQRTTSAKSAIQETREDGNSTTAYLMEKAEADAREHAKEKFEEQKRLYETRGGLAVAERYLDGDTIPQGKKCINCGYCGAENLIPMIPRTKYSCYFCREPL